MPCRPTLVAHNAQYEKGADQLICTNWVEENWITRTSLILATPLSLKQRKSEVTSQKQIFIGAAFRSFFIAGENASYWDYVQKKHFITENTLYPKVLLYSLNAFS